MQLFFLGLQTTPIQCIVKTSLIRDADVLLQLVVHFALNNQSASQPEIKRPVGTAALPFMEGSLSFHRVIDCVRQLAESMLYPFTLATSRGHCICFCRKASGAISIDRSEPPTFPLRTSALKKLTKVAPWLLQLRIVSKDESERTQTRTFVGSRDLMCRPKSANSFLCWTVAFGRKKGLRRALPAFSLQLAYRSGDVRSAHSSRP